MIVIGDKKFNLPRRLLCHCSPVLEKTLQSFDDDKLEDGMHQKLILTDVTESEGFEFVIKWMYTSSLGFFHSTSQPERIIQLIDFFQLVNYLKVSGPFESIFPEIEPLFDGDTNYEHIFDCQHVRDVFALPSDNPLVHYFERCLSDELIKKMLA